MSNTIFMNVRNSRNHLLKNFTSLLLIKSYCKKIDYFFSLIICLKSYPLGMYSVINKRLFSVSIISYKWIICLCLTLESTFIYVLMRQISFSAIFCLEIILTATFSPVGKCIPRWTLPKVPYPIVLPKFQIKNLLRI
jgi:hypothetical protein